MNKRKEDIIEKDNEYMRWKARSDALKERIELNKQYSSIMEKFNTRLKDKPVKYQQKMKTVEDTVDDLAIASQWKPLIPVAK